VGVQSRIRYREDFDFYKKFISENFAAPGIVATFAQINQEILGVSSPGSASALDGQSEDQDIDEEAARMRAEVWEEHGTSLLAYLRCS